jgi:hypothetical protein
MSGIVLCMATLVAGADFGYQPLPGGGMEYIIQIEPWTRESLRPDDHVDSDIPADVRDVRKVRIVFGNDKLPKTLATIGRATVMPIPASAPPKTGKPAAPPATFSPDPAGKLMPASHTEESPNPVKSETPAPSSSSTPPPQPAKPWMLLWAAVLTLCASLTGNVYLGWIYYEVRKRCRALLGRTAEAAAE